MTRILILILAAVLLCLPLILHGTVPNAADATEHINWYRSFSDEFGFGDLYPRWLTTLNGGLGGPALFVYGPASYYAATALRPLTGGFAGSRPLLPFDLSFVLALALSGVTSYLWMRRRASRNAALIAAVIYMLLPSHLYFSVYYGAGISTLWAYVALPLALLGVEKSAAREISGIAVLAGGIALLLLSNLLMALVSLMLILPYAAVLAMRRRSVASVAMLAAGGVLGVGLAAAYFLPALEHEKYIPAQTLVEEGHYAYSSNFLPFNASLIKRGERRSSWYIAWFTIATWILIGACAFISRRSKSREVLLWLIFAAAATLMMTVVSKPLYEAIPVLRQIQFPWRFQIVLVVCSLPAVAAAASERWSGTGWPVRLALAASLGVVFLCLATVPYAATLYSRKISPEFVQDMRVRGDYLRRVYLHWSDREIATDPWRLEALARATPQASVSGAPGSVSVLTWKPRDIVLHVACPAPCKLAVGQFYYPPWRAKDLTNNRTLQIQPAPRTGLISVDLPAAGSQASPATVELKIPESLAEILGRYTSLASLLLLLVVAVASRRYRLFPPKLSARGSIR